MPKPLSSPAGECVIYARISRDHSGTGLGVERQETACRELAARLGLTVRKVYTDNDISAAGRKPRPAYREMLAGLEADPCAVLCWHVDRLHRKPVELDTFVDLIERRPIRVHTVNSGELDLSTSNGRLVARLLGDVAKHEVEHMAERHRAAKAQAAANGLWRGGRRPFGYEKDGVTIRPVEAELIRSGTMTICEGATLASVMRAWNAAGVPTTTGRAWKPGAVSRTLCRARNAALIEHDGEIIGPASWAAVVTESQWRTARAILTNPARRNNAGAERRWMLSGLARCGTCGGGLIGTSARERGGHRAIYRCKEPGLHVSRDARSLDAYVSGAVCGVLSKPECIRDWDTGQPAGDTGLIAARLESVRRQLDELAAEAGRMTITARQMAIASAPLEAERERLESALATAVRPDIRPYAGMTSQDWLKLPLQNRRNIISMLFTITVLPSPRGRPSGWKPGQGYFHYDSIRITPRRGGTGEGTGASE